MAPDLLWDGRVVMERNEGEVVRGMVGALRLWPASLRPSIQDNASKLLLALMESRHDSENAERILISLRPQELVRLGRRAGGRAGGQAGLGGVCWDGDEGQAGPTTLGREHWNRHCPSRWTSSRRPTCRKKSVRTRR